jgi:hypothetical protein
MADLTSQPTGLTIVKLGDYEEYEFDILSTAAAFYNGGLIDLITQGANAGECDHANDTNFDRQFVGVAINNPIGGVTAATAPNGRLRVARGLIVMDVYSLEAGTPGAGDFGRPMYVGSDDNTIGDYSNVTALKQRFAGTLRPNADRSSFDSLYVPNDMQVAHNGLVVRHGVTAITGESIEIAKATTGLEEIVHVTANIEEGVAVATAAHVTVKPHATAGSIEVSVFKESGGALVASTVAANIHWTAFGNILPVLA